MGTEPSLPQRRESRLKFLSVGVDASSLAIFRIVFGVLILAAVLRFFQNGWIDKLYVQPDYFFTYPYFSWIRPWPAWGLQLHFALLAFFSLMVTLGLYYRLSIVLLFFGFTYIELLDQSNYLNHYYLVSLLAFLMVFLPMHAKFSLDAVWRRKQFADTVPLWTVVTLRLQIALVYFFAGLAKLNSDWMLHGQPMRIWLGANGDFPVLGTWFQQPWCGYLFSWAGAAFDLSAPFLLSRSKTRLPAYLVGVVFHVLTWLLFPIGMFPWIMIFGALIFFPPDWPRLFSKKGNRTAPRFSSFRVPWLPLTLYFVLQIFLPLRHLLYPGELHWTEEGFRFSWQVMVMEKNGAVEYRAVDRKTRETWVLLPREYLQPHQTQQMSTQPDMIGALAQKIHADFAKQGRDVAVYADSVASLNGRPNQILVRPDVDLSQVKLGWRRAAWIQSFRRTAPP